MRYHRTGGAASARPRLGFGGIRNRDDVRRIGKRLRRFDPARAGVVQHGYRQRSARGERAPLLEIQQMAVDDTMAAEHQIGAQVLKPRMHVRPMQPNDLNAGRRIPFLACIAQYDQAHSMPPGAMLRPVENDSFGAAQGKAADRRGECSRSEVEHARLDAGSQRRKDAFDRVLTGQAQLVGAQFVTPRETL